MRNYCEHLYTDNTDLICDYGKEQDIQLDENIQPQKLKYGKVVEIYITSIEVLQLMKERRQNIIYQLCQNIGNTCSCSTDYLISIVISLHKRSAPLIATINA